MRVVVASVMMIGVAQAQPVKCMDSETVERVRTIMQDGIDTALKQHAASLFSVWQKDPADEPKRAIAGMNRAIKAYVGSRDAVKRWSPQLCPGGTP